KHENNPLRYLRAFVSSWQRELQQPTRCSKLMASRSSRTLVLAIITFATFTDIVAYSVAVPVLPDLTRKLGASPTMVGLLFGSFGMTLLLTAIPMGAVSDRVGRKV